MVWVYLADDIHLDATTTIIDLICCFMLVRFCRRNCFKTDLIPQVKQKSTARNARKSVPVKFCGWPTNTSTKAAFSASSVINHWPLADFFQKTPTITVWSTIRKRSEPNVLFVSNTSKVRLSRPWVTHTIRSASPAPSVISPSSRAAR